MDSSTKRRAVFALTALLTVFGYGVCRAQDELHDTHFHLLNYIQEGPAIQDVMPILRDTGITRSVLFGIPRRSETPYAADGLGKRTRAQGYYLWAGENTGWRLNPVRVAAADCRLTS